MTHDTLRWEQVLRHAGHRVTRQRGVILDAVCAGNGHTSLGDIYARAHRKDPSLDRSTVYRALKLFVDVDLVVAAEPGDGETYYEIKRLEHHHHLICRRCGDDQEIDDSAFKDMIDQVAQRYGFEIATDHVVLFGTCSRCTHKSRSPEWVTGHA
jgi:Fur family transcriptional regulator, ferric uptake regulator